MARVLRICAALISVCVYSMPSASAGELPPNGKLSIGYRQLVDGNLSKAVYYATLTCYDGDCHLTTLALNQCLPTPFGEKEAFIPKIERSATSEGTLSVRMRNANTLIATEKNGEAIYTYHFTFASRQDTNLAALLKVKQTRFFVEKQAVEGFKGEAVKDSVTQGKMITWELVPLTNPQKGVWPVIKLDCDLALPYGGVDK